jgi:hypothetical protein
MKLPPYMKQVAWRRDTSGNPVAVIEIAWWGLLWIRLQYEARLFHRRVSVPPCLCASVFGLGIERENGRRDAEAQRGEIGYEQDTMNFTGEV